MTYKETIDYLFNVAPLFQNIGQGAYKEGLSNTHALDEHFGHPHGAFRTIHVAGTNGKGSCSHTLAAILQESGLKVGLYTSPHLVDFRERIRVNGEMISEQRVIDFVEQERSFFEPLYPSFFELTTALAFLYFKEQQVDVAVIEVGLGGRLDCTNIITPDLSIITNISFDHTQFLGDTLAKIAAEKAGIIKHNVPVVVGETNGHEEVKDVFLTKAQSVEAPIIFADETGIVIASEALSNGGRRYQTKSMGELNGALGGDCQTYNASTILNAVDKLREADYEISDEHVRRAFANVCHTTGLMGRWQRISEHPLVICDTGHNVGGLHYISRQLEAMRPAEGTLRMVIGMVGDKDVRGSLSLLPKNASYYFTQASVKRAMDVKEFQRIAASVGLEGECFGHVEEAYKAAMTDAERSMRENASANDLIFVGGSSFIVADFLQFTTF